MRLDEIQVKHLQSEHETKFCYSDGNKYVFRSLSTLPGSTAPLDESLTDCACSCVSASAVLTPSQRIESASH